MTTQLFANGACQKAINKICSYLCLHAILRNRILCTSLNKGFRWAKKRLENKFGKIYILGLRIYVSTDKAIKPEYYHYFVYREIYAKFPNVIMKANKIFCIETLVFINLGPGDWSLNMPSVQRKIKSFKFNSLVPARLDCYMSKVILDTGDGLAIVAHESCANYFYYDSVETTKDARVYTKKMTVRDHIDCRNKEITRIVTCHFPKNYEGVGKLAKCVPGTIEKMPYKQLAKMTFVVDHMNGKAIMFEKFDVDHLFFLDTDCIKTIELGSLYKKYKGTRCKNM